MIYAPRYGCSSNEFPNVYYGIKLSVNFQGTSMTEVNRLSLIK